MTQKVFKYVRIPCEASDPMEELEFPAVEGLGDDPFIEHLKDVFQSGGKEVHLDTMVKAMSAHAKQNLDDKMDDQMREKVRSMKSLDIFPISVPVQSTGFHGVSMYCDDKGIAKDLPINNRAQAFIEAC